MKGVLPLICAMSLAWNIALALMLRDLSDRTQGLLLAREENLILARELEAQASALAIEFRLLVQNRTVILVQGER